jgi:hypothetical protein
MLNPAEAELEKWIADVQSTTDELCHQMRAIVRSGVPHEVAMQQIMGVLLAHQLVTANMAGNLLAGIGLPVKPVLPAE